MKSETTFSELITTIQSVHRELAGYVRPMSIPVNPGISDSRIVATASPQSEINPPVGILLCTGKNHALVEYALAGMDNQLFVSKYQLELPDKEQMQRFIDEQLREAGG